MKLVHDFSDYQLLDLSCGEKYEKWGKYLFVRPDPQIIFGEEDSKVKWSYDARYIRSNTGGGTWNVKNKLFPSMFFISYHDMTFNLKLMGFKHTGLFPEQAYNWNYIRYKIKTSKKKVRVLNLFAYTGAMSIASLMEGASVVHVDASRGMVDWAKENVKSNHLENGDIHFFVDDVVKFVKREIRRGSKYDMIIMDPPSFGRGSKKEVWSIEKNLYSLVKDCTEILSDDPILFLINSYSTGVSKTILEDILNLTVQKKYKGHVSSDELGIPVLNRNLVLPCGIYGRWEKDVEDHF